MTVCRAVPCRAVPYIRRGGGCLSQSSEKRGFLREASDYRYMYTVYDLRLCNKEKKNPNSIKVTSCVCSTAPTPPVPSVR